LKALEQCFSTSGPQPDLFLSEKFR